MRKTLAVICATCSLALGGAGIANATVESGPAPSSTTTTLADNNNHNNQQDNDKSGLWGLAGLLGLVGLVGLKRRKDTDVAARPTTTPGRGF